MATLVNLSGFQRGVEADETGINIDTYEVVSRPEFRDDLPDKSGEVRGFAVGQTMSEITITGEVSGGTGIMAVVSSTAATIANDVNQFGQTVGGSYAVEFTQSQSRDGFRRVNVRFQRYAGVT